MWYLAGVAEPRTIGHVVTTKRVYKGKTYRAHLLMRSFRDASGRVRKETLANLTPLGDEIVAAIKSWLKGEPVGVGEGFKLASTLPHGHVMAVLAAMGSLGMAGLLAGRACRERSLILGLVAQRVIDPLSKLATTRAWNATSLASELGIGDASEDEVYRAMDWLVKRQGRIEGRLAERHLREGGSVMFDLSSTFVEGKACRLAGYGYSRDKKRGKKQVNWGVLTDGDGRPISVSVYPGNTKDEQTIVERVMNVRERFGLKAFTVVGDRGMLTSHKIARLKDLEGVSWVSALPGEGIKPLIGSGVLQPSLFDEADLFEFAHADYPGERLIACKNPITAARARKRRAELLARTLAELDKVKERVAAGRLKDAGKIGMTVGRKIGAFKMAKHITCDISDGTFEYHVDHAGLDLEATLDGVYVIRTSVSDEALPTAKAVLTYKRLSRLEQGFRTHKSLELLVRPVHHHLDDRVRAHFFICLLAYYVQWHMKRAWEPITFADERKDDDRDPVKPAKPSPEANAKARYNRLPDGSRPHSFRTLLRSLATITKGSYYYPANANVTFPITTDATPEQARALELLKTISL